MKRIMWDDHKNMGFKENDKALIVGPSRYLEALKEMHTVFNNEKKMSIKTLQESHILQNAIWACRNEKSKKKFTNAT